MDVQWIRVSDEAESWHIVKTVEYPDDGGDGGIKHHTLCGLIPNKEDRATIVDDRPGHEKTCESCLRIVAPE